MTMWALLRWPTALGFQEPHLLRLLEFANGILPKILQRQECQNKL